MSAVIGDRPKMRSDHTTAGIGSILAATVLVVNIAGCGSKQIVEEPADEAKAAGKRVGDFPEATDDIFREMDGGIRLSNGEIKGRSTWMMWTAGNESFWDHMARHSHGLVDLLKLLDSRRRSSRFADAGLINEPGFKQAAAADEFGLWLDEQIAPASAEADPAVHGRSSGIIGLRLFPNPNFDETARANWRRDRYYDDPEYSAAPDLIRPYRVGMSCAFCHAAFHPLRPPDNVTAPEWEHLSSNIGNQYWRTAGVFGTALKGKASFVYELLSAAPPGTTDTSLLATDANNNPTAINPLFLLGERLARAKKNPAEIIDPSRRAQHVPHILMDGADSVGIHRAIARVYVSIGAFHQQWLRNHNLLVGLRPQTPFSVATARKNSVYWQVTEARADNVAKFLAKVSGPMPLPDLYVTKNDAILTRGKIVFAENCISCHSSKQFADGATLSPEGWRDWAHSEQYLNWARAEVLKPTFLKDNFLSTDQRYPVTLIKTNAGRALADNATRGHIWNDFSSETYKLSPSVGAIDVWSPFDDTTAKFQPPGGGPGYYRVPSLVGIWTSAPFLHNNSVGTFTGDPSIAGRLRVFDDAIEKLLWPERRPDRKSILRTREETWLRIPRELLPDFLQQAAGEKHLVLGPIPAGTPINLLANINPRAVSKPKLIELALKIRHVLGEAEKMNEEEARRHMRDTLAANLFALSKSPDFVEDRGHYFGSRLSDSDKRALMEFLKTF